MKLNKKQIQTLIFICLYLFGLYFWTQPLQDRKLPYGEYDAMSHFEVADYMSYNDKSFMDLPPYIDLRYGQDNKYKPHTLWYPPTFHSALGIMQSITGDRVVSAFLMNAIFATFIIISVYFLVNSLFGFLPAILSSALLIFSPRDIMPYLWGQWPERFGYAFIPIVLYCVYRYFITYSKEESRPIYLYLTSLFLILNLLVHPMTFFHSLVSIFFLFIFLAIKQKKLPINWKHISISVLIFIIIFFAFPLQTFNVVKSFVGASDNNSENSLEISRIFKWSLNPKEYSGSVPEFYFSYESMHGTWTLIPLIIGIIILLLRRKEKDIFFLSWLISLYFILHRDLIGKAAFLHRSLSATAHIFAPVTAIGIVYLVNLFKIPEKPKKYIQYGLAAVFVFLVISVNLSLASSLLNKETYSPYSNSGFFTSLNEDEVQAANWVLENVPENRNISIIGIPHESNYLSATAKKIRWFMAVSQHVTRFYELREDKNATLKEFYILMDYTMIAPLNDKQRLEYMQDFEKTTLSSHELLYNKNNIRIYKNGN